MATAVPLRGLNVYAKEWSRSCDGDSRSTSGKIICQFFAMGHCRDGDSCTMSHSLTQEAPAGVDSSSGFFISGRVVNVHNSGRPNGSSGPAVSTVGVRSTSTSSTATFTTAATNPNTSSCSSSVAGGSGEHKPHSSLTQVRILVPPGGDSRNVSPAFEHVPPPPVPHSAPHPPPGAYHLPHVYAQTAPPMDCAAQHQPQQQAPVHSMHHSATAATPFASPLCGWLASPAALSSSSSTTADRSDLGSTSRSPPLAPPPPPSSVAAPTHAGSTSITMNPVTVGSSWTSSNTSGSSSFAHPSTASAFHSHVVYPQSSPVSASTPLVSAVQQHQRQHHPHQAQSQPVQHSPVVPNAFWASYQAVPPVSPVAPTSSLPPQAPSSGSYYAQVGGSPVAPTGVPAPTILASYPYAHVPPISGANGIRSSTSTAVVAPVASTLHFANSCPSQGQQSMYSPVTMSHAALPQSFSQPPMFAPSRGPQLQQPQQSSSYVVGHEGRPQPPLYQSSGGVLVAATASPIVAEFSSSSLGIAGSSSATQQPFSDAYRTPLVLGHTVEPHSGVHGFFQSSALSSAPAQTSAHRQFLTVDGVDCAARRTSDPKYVGPPPIQ